MFQRKKIVPPRYFNFPLGLFQFAIFQCDPPGGGAVTTSIFEPTFFASISTTSMMSGKIYIYTKRLVEGTVRASSNVRIR